MTGAVSISPRGTLLLLNGDRMRQPEFHVRYRQCPPDAVFELVAGTVFMASPVRWPHGSYHQKLSLVLGIYEAQTPGVEAGDNVTVILGEESEPQPDLCLRLAPELGGQSRLDEEEYVVGPPELVAEVAYSSRALDLNQKLEDYRRAGVGEYLVLCIEDQALRWFRFPSGEEIEADRRGVCRSVIFPGLWVHQEALLARDAGRLLAVARQGVASRPHAAFLRQLQRRTRKPR